jgi:hypothetical protein
MTGPDIWHAAVEHVVVLVGSGGAGYALRMAADTFRTWADTRSAERLVERAGRPVRVQSDKFRYVEVKPRDDAEAEAIRQELLWKSATEVDPPAASDG